MPEKIKFDISTAAVAKIILAVFAIWLIYTVRDIIVLFFVVLVIVAALSPVVDRMSKHIPRVLALIILSLGFLVALAAVGYLFVPTIVYQLSQLAINLPIIAGRFEPYYAGIQQAAANYQESLFNLSAQLGRLTSGLYATTVSFVTGLMAFFTILILSFYMLLEQKSIEAFLLNLMPENRKQKMIEILQKIADKMGKWLRGQALLMLAIGLLDGIGLVALGVPYPLVLAVWGGITEVIPYIGPWLGLIPAFLVALTVSPLKALLILIVYVVIQQLEAQFLAPKIMGRAVGLSPVIIILSLLVGAKLMGILGVIIAVPVAAAIAVVIQEWPHLRQMYSGR